MKTSLISLLAAGVLGALLPLAAGAETAIALPDVGFAPEGIAVDAAGTLYTGSLTQGRVVSIAPQNHRVTDFVPAGSNGLVSVIGMHVAGNHLYACSSDPGASQFTGTKPVALVRFDLKTGAPAGRFEVPEGGGFCNDITELPDGTILATDSFVPRIYALRPGAEALEVWLDDPQFAGEGFNLNGIAYDDGHVYVLHYRTGTLHRVALNADGSSGAVDQVALPQAITGPDGLTALGDGRFLIVEGGGLKSGARGSLIGVRVGDTSATLDVIAPDLNVPTTAAVLDGVAYVVEGQLDHLFDPDAGAADPYRILKIDLPETYR